MPRGRPKILNKPKVIQLALQEEDLKRVDQAARESGMSRAAWIRYQCILALGKKK